MVYSDEGFQQPALRGALVLFPPNLEDEQPWRYSASYLIKLIVAGVRIEALERLPDLISRSSTEVT